jgi:hypothetical protein
MKATLEDEIALDEDALAKLRTSMSGQIIGPEDEGYEQIRRVYNAMIDKYPRLIARCADVADVMAVVNFARDNGLCWPQGRRPTGQVWGATTAWC